MNEFISIKEIGIEIGDPKMDTRTIKGWLNDKNIKIQKIGGQLKVNKICILIAKEEILVNSLKHQFQNDWVTVYKTLAGDCTLKKIVLQINKKDVDENSTYESEYFNSIKK